MFTALVRDVQSYFWNVPALIRTSSSHFRAFSSRLVSASSPQPHQRQQLQAHARRPQYRLLCQACSESAA